MRLEYKYLVSSNRLADLRKALLPFVEYDSQYNDSPEYTVRSIYFDTSRLKYYHEKINGIQVRKKLRIRGYNAPEDESVIFLEIKRKYENYINKNRSALKLYNLSELIRTKDIESYVLKENGFADSVRDAEYFLHHIYKRSLKPIILIVYDREAFFSKFDPRLRITLDKNLRYLMFPSLDMLYSEQDLCGIFTNNFILEIKFSNGFPKWLQNLLSKFNLSRRALSKYTMCLENEKIINPANRRSLIGLSESFTEFHTYHGE
ncbi:MAG: polyphosphate polymerase domain-containing protein [Melioribacteraceae bacterium]|nr:polyphosphate polymerase domain-containing protein [Melioribacteraceae bacterium]